MANMSASSIPSAGKPLKGLHILFWFLGFFGLMFVVNGIFLWAALSSFPGEDVQHSYLQGLHFNQKIATLRHQEDMGWRAEIGLVSQEGGKMLVTRLADKNGTPLPARNVTAELRRAATQKSDIVLEMQAVGGGEYQAVLPLLSKGAWHVALSADILDREDDATFSASKLITVP